MEFRVIASKKALNKLLVDWIWNYQNNLRWPNPYHKDSIHQIQNTDKRDQKINVHYFIDSLIPIFIIVIW